MNKAFEKIIGNEKLKQELDLIADILHSREKYQKSGMEVPTGLLLYGKHGIGKTLAAECLIEATGLPAIRCKKDTSDFEGKLASAFNEARSKEPCILFFDDLDGSEHEKFSFDTTDYTDILDEIDDSKGLNIFYLATASDRQSIPKALRKAGGFNWIIEIPSPRAHDRELIVKHFMKEHHVDDGILEDAYRIIEQFNLTAVEKAMNLANSYAVYAGRSSIVIKDIIEASFKSKRSITARVS